MLTFELAETVLKLPILYFRFLDGFLDFSSLSDFTFFDFFGQVLLLKLSVSFLLTKKFDFALV